MLCKLNRMSRTKENKKKREWTDCKINELSVEMNSMSKKNKWTWNVLKWWMNFFFQLSINDDRWLFIHIYSNNRSFYILQIETEQNYSIRYYFIGLTIWQKKTQKLLFDLKTAKLWNNVKKIPRHSYILSPRE